MQKPALVLLMTALLANPASATDREGETCSPQLYQTSDLLMPPMPRELDVYQLSCSGIAGLYLILTSTDEVEFSRKRSQIMQLFRNEGLID